jgi:hypothetical protein
MRSRCCPCVCARVCLCIPPIVARQRLRKNPHNYLCILWDHLAVWMCPHSCFIFYAVRVVSKENRRLVLPRTSCLFVPGCFNFLYCNQVSVLSVLSRGNGITWNTGQMKLQVIKKTCNTEKGRKKSASYNFVPTLQESGWLSRYSD